MDTLHVTTIKESNERVGYLGDLVVLGDAIVAVGGTTSARASAAELVRAVGNESLPGRHHAVRALGAHGSDATTHAVARAVEALLARAPAEPGGGLSPTDDCVPDEAYEVLRLDPGPSTLALFNRLLLHPNRDVRLAGPARPAEGPRARRGDAPRRRRQMGVAGEGSARVAGGERAEVA